MILRLGGQRIPSDQIVKVFLHDDIAAASELRILRPDHRGVDRPRARGIFRPVDKAEQIAAVEVAKAVDLVDRRSRGPDPFHDLRRQLEAQIHALRPDVEQQVARGSDGMAPSRLDLAKGA